MDYADDIGVRVVCGGDIGEDGWGFYVDIRTSAGWEDHRIDVRSYMVPEDRCEEMERVVNSLLECHHPLLAKKIEPTTTEPPPTSQITRFAERVAAVMGKE